MGGEHADAAVARHGAAPAGEAVSWTAGAGQAGRWLARRWLHRRSLAMVPLALVVAAGSTATMLTLATAQRTGSAYDDFLDRADVADVIVNPSLLTHEIDDVIRSLPGVDRVTHESLFAVTMDDGVPRTRHQLERPDDFESYVRPVDGRPGVWAIGDSVGDEVAIIDDFIVAFGSPDGGNVEIGIPVIESGRLATGANEVMLNVSAAESNGIEVGDVVPVAFWEGTFVASAMGDYETYLAETVAPIGVEHAEVVGIITLPDEVLPDNLYPRQLMILSAALTERYECPLLDLELATATGGELMAAMVAVPCASNYTYYRLAMEDGAEGVASALDEFVRRAATLSPPPGGDSGMDPDDAPPIAYQLFSTESEQLASQVRRSIRPTVAALGVLGLASAVLTVAMVGLAAMREMRATRGDQQQWYQLGVATRARAAVAAIPIVAVVVVGCAVGLLGGWLLDHGPIGMVAAVEPDPERRFSGVGALAVVGLAVVASLAVALITFRASRQIARQTSSVSRVSGAVPSRRIGSPAVAHGVTAAYRHRTSVPVIASVGLLVGTLIATSVFAASMSALISTPRAYGWPWDVAAVHGFGYESQFTIDEFAAVLDGDPDVDSWTAFAIQSGVSVAGHPMTGLIGYDRTADVDLPVVSGELPSAPDEIAIGATVGREAGIGVGDRVELGVTGAPPWSATVTGVVVFPTLGPFRAERTAPGVGVLFAESFLSPEEAEWAASFIGVELAADAGPDAAARVQRTIAATDPAGIDVGIGYPSPVRPPEIVDVRSTLAVPIVVCLAFAIVSAAALAAASWASIRTHRRELAILRTLGFSGAQVRTSVRVQSLATMIAALLFAVPVGVIIGRSLWRAFAVQLGVVTHPAASWLVVAGIVIGGLVVAVAAAELPARAAARALPADGLRGE